MTKKELIEIVEFNLNRYENDFYTCLALDYNETVELLKILKAEKE